jgi:CO dehydrogenase maturation factor
MCSNHSTVRGILKEVPDDDRLVIVDTGASPEQFTRGTTESIDVMLVVAEPYFKSLETARRYHGFARQLGIPRTWVISNKVRGAEDGKAIEDFCRHHDMEILASIPHDPSLAEAERLGAAPLDHNPASPLVRAASGIATQLLDLEAA